MPEQFGLPLEGRDEATEGPAEWCGAIGESGDGALGQAGLANLNLSNRRMRPAGPVVWQKSSGAPLPPMPIGGEEWVDSPPVRRSQRQT